MSEVSKSESMKLRAEKARIEAETERLLEELESLRETKRVLSARIEAYERALASAQSHHAAHECRASGAVDYWVIDGQTPNESWDRIRKSFVAGADTVVSMDAFGLNAGKIRTHLLPTRDAVTLDHYAFVSDMRKASEALGEELASEEDAKGLGRVLKDSGRKKSTLRSR